jgi:hypothetical protein
VWAIRSSGKASFKYFRQTLMTSADSGLEVRNNPASGSKGQVANPLGGWEAKSDYSGRCCVRGADCADTFCMF